VVRAGRCSLAAQIPLNHAALTAFPKLGVTARPCCRRQSHVRKIFLFALTAAL
jgi:hypothetical protein